MNDYRRNDAGPEAALNGGIDDAWEEPEFQSFAEDVKSAFIQPIDVATRSKQLSAIAAALPESKLGVSSPPVAQRVLRVGGRCAPTTPRPAGPARPEPRAGLSSPFARPVAPVPPAPRLRGKDNVINLMTADTSKARRRARSLPLSMATRAAAVAAVVAIGAGGFAVTRTDPQQVGTVYSETSKEAGVERLAPQPISPQATESPARANALVPPPSPAPPAPAPMAVPSVAPLDPSQLGQPAVPAPQATSAPAPPQNFETWLAEMMREAIAESARSQSSGSGPQQSTSRGGNWQSGSGQHQADEPDSAPSTGSYRTRSYRP